ncbi:serine protease [Thermopolyspora flexuosa]|uniref:Subtilase family protein n=1 Tax=Thermopolyspora flexuosa TaxID=103836 RepID=A0A543J1B1_9ACTN|nr:S8 family serine peptidase [Thermopolyspora flexuosa]TQM76609.1 subtilase family protein [Thermopolyspora flexuosa]GGM85479.1 serine protease [Thermopolyspora flexuosa]
MKRVSIVAAAVLVTAALATPAQALPSSAVTSGRSATESESEFLVLYAEGADPTAARNAIEAAGGTIVKENGAIGLATVTSRDAGFAAALAGNGLIEGVARDRVIGAVPKTRPARPSEALRRAIAERAVEKEGHRDRRHLPHRPGKPRDLAEPLAELQWDMKQIDATATGAHRVEQGDRRVLVGVIDTGIDGSHPDIAPNFSRELSRNFTVDIPYDANGEEVDGPCEAEPDRSCTDPADVDENDHGTHVAATIAAPINGLGIAGVAPKVTLVNLRVGQDSGYFFLQPVVDALTYAADIGVDVVNMSFYIDPWQFNCTDNPADSPEERAEQATVIKAAQRALDYAHRRGVTLISSQGNDGFDLTKENIDRGSPNFASVPGLEPRTRTVPPSCQVMPTEGNHVISVSSTGISRRKSYYSSYGNGSVDVAAPGGDAYDTPTGDLDRTRTILAAYPKALAEERGELNPDGTPNVPTVVRDCDAKGTCAYYQYLQGTSMAAPHAAGVAALIVSRYGKPDRHRGGLTLDPDTVERIMKSTATKIACPPGGSYTYTRRVPQQDGSVNTVVTTHTCEGTAARNGFYGSGLVNALNAVRAHR